MKSTDRDGIEYHDALAADWSARYARGGFRRRQAFIAGRVLPAAPAGERWVDVGCGSGVFSRLLAARGADVTGLDGSAAMIAAARAQTAETGAGSVTYRCIALEEIAPAAGEAGGFDGALCFSVLEYVADPDSALAMLASLLKPGGVLLLSVPNRLSVVRLAQKAAHAAGRRAGSSYLAVSRAAYSRQGIISTLNRNGFTIQRIIGFDPVLPTTIATDYISSLHFITAIKS